MFKLFFFIASEVSFGETITNVMKQAKVLNKKHNSFATI